MRYEELDSNRVATLSALAERLAFPWSPGQAERAMRVGASWSTVSPPRRDKWREARSAEIEAILPMIAEAQARLGYGSPAMDAE